MSVKALFFTLLLIATEASTLSDSSQSECPVCLSDYERRLEGIELIPFSLPCSHKVCHECFPRLPRHECPYCRAPYEVLSNDHSSDQRRSPRHPLLARRGPPINIQHICLSDILTRARQLTRLRIAYAMTSHLLHGRFTNCLEAFVEGVITDCLLVAVSRL